jgi:hypothetical protein
VEQGSSSYGIPNPGIYVLDPSGKVKAKYFEDDYRERQTAAAILLREFGMEPATPHASITAKHLVLSTRASSIEARMGRHVSLLVDVDLPARSMSTRPESMATFPSTGSKKSLRLPKQALSSFRRPRPSFSKQSKRECRYLRATFV